MVPLGFNKAQAAPDGSPVIQLVYEFVDPSTQFQAEIWLCNPIQKSPEKKFKLKRSEKQQVVIFNRFANKLSNKPVLINLF